MISYLKEHVFGAVIIALLLAIGSLMLYFNTGLQDLRTNYAVVEYRLDHIDGTLDDIKEDVRHIRDRDASVEVLD